MKKTAGYIALLLAFLLAVSCSASSQRKKLYDKIEVAIEQENWTKVLALCNQYLELTHNDTVRDLSLFEPRERLYYPLILLYTKLSLAASDELLENFFAYVEYPGFSELFPQPMEEGYVRIDNRMFYHFFSNAGLHAMAINSALGRMATEGGQPSALNDFIRSSLIVGNYRACEVFVNQLEQHRSWRKQARAYKALLADTAAINADPFYTQQRQALPKTNFEIQYIDLDMWNLYHSNPYNQRALEYIITLALMEKQTDAIMPYIDTLLTRFDYAHIPRHLEEAILVHLDYGANPDISQTQMRRMTFGGKTIRIETIRRSEKFLDELTLMAQGRFPLDLFRENFGDTYWFSLFVE